MNATLVSISKKYAFQGDTVDYQVRVTLGSGEKITNDIVAIVFSIANRGWQIITFENQTISSGGSKTYSFSVRVIPHYFNDCPDGAWYDIIVSSFDIAKFTALEATIERAGSFRVEPIAPVIDGYTISDNHPLNPLEHFGAFVQNRSIPNFRFNAVTDPFDPTLTTTDTLAITWPGGTERRDTQWDDPFFEIASGSLDEPGTYTWTYTVTDSTGRSATESGSFEVLAYAPPRIDALHIQRYTESVDDEGNHVYTTAADGDRIWITIDATVASVAGVNAWTLKRTREDTPSQLTLLSGDDGEHIARIDDRSLDTSIYSPNNSIDVTITLSDFFETVERCEEVLKAGAFFHITPHGVAVGMRSTATAEQKKFEVAEGYEVDFHGASVGNTNYVEGEMLTGDTWIDGKPIYRYVYQGTYKSTGGHITISTALKRSQIGTLFMLIGTVNASNAKQWIPLSTASSANLNRATHLYISDDGIRLNDGGYYSGTNTITVRAEYTKV